MVESGSLGVRHKFETPVFIPSPPSLCSCVAKRELLNLSEPQFPDL